MRIFRNYNSDSDYGNIQADLQNVDNVPKFFQNFSGMKIFMETPLKSSLLCPPLCLLGMGEQNVGGIVEMVPDNFRTPFTLN